MPHTEPDEKKPSNVCYIIGTTFCLLLLLVFIASSSLRKSKDQSWEL